MLSKIFTLCYFCKAWISFARARKTSYITLGSLPIAVAKASTSSTPKLKISAKLSVLSRLIFANEIDKPSATAAESILVSSSPEINYSSNPSNVV
jgi:hypothetical protein